MIITFNLQEQTALLAELERVTKLSEEVMRHSIVKVPPIKPAAEKEAPPSEKEEAAVTEPSAESTEAQPAAQPSAAPTESLDEKPSAQGGNENA